MASSPSPTTCRWLRTLRVCERLPGQADVARVVLDQQDLDRRSRFSLAHHGRPSLHRQGEVKRAIPGPGSDSTQMRPAVALDDLLADRQADAGARVLLAAVQPLEDARRCGRSTAGRCRCRCRARRTPTRRAFAPRRDVDARAVRAARNLMALPIRFWKSWTSWLSSARTVGSGSWVTTAPLSSMATAQVARAPAPAPRSQSVGRRGLAPRADPRVGQQVVDQPLHAAARRPPRSR